MQAKHEGTQGMQRLQGMQREARKKERLSGLGSQDFFLQRRKSFGYGASASTTKHLRESIREGGVDQASARPNLALRCSL